MKKASVKRAGSVFLMDNGLICSYVKIQKITREYQKSGHERAGEEEQRQEGK
jgi:hypothetical protein